jgi:hypothetical protein
MADHLRPGAAPAVASKTGLGTSALSTGMAELGLSDGTQCAGTDGNRQIMRLQILGREIGALQHDDGVTAARIALGLEGLREFRVGTARFAQHDEHRRGHRNA